MNKIKEKIYIKKLLKETDNKVFLKKVYYYNKRINLLLDISTLNYIYDTKKIKKHYKTIEDNYLNNKDNTINYLQKKKIAFNYHLYLLKKYYDYLYEKLFT